MTDSTPGSDLTLHERIESLAHEEHALRQAHGSGGLSDADRARLAEIELSLDRTWDLLRQREARRDAGLDPNGAAPRPPSVVEDYLQ